MTRKSNNPLLNDLDELITEYKLHDGDYRTPVSLRELISSTVQIEWYWYMPSELLGVAVIDGGEAGVTFNKELQEPERSSDYRHAQAHDLGHIVRKHEGMYRHWRRDWISRNYDFGRYLRSRVEKECELISAYLLISYSAIKALKDEGSEYVANLLDVPIHLVELRIWIFNKYGQ